MLSNNEDVLNVIFKVADNLEYEVDENNIVTVLEKQEHKIQQLMRKLNFEIPKYKKITLDEYSSYVFLKIDGEKTVKDIGESLEKRYGDKVNPLYERLLLFLNHIDVNCHYIKKTNV
ncbi:PqqD family protein [Clostridium fermenticellae]|uniref:PqqD family protein n=1 Tax=Clostridium fermenticellae TaxID=2068654 RepID=A0A386H3L8_9CLOT|nr:PqqD family protein [Clostridium fermenticellae]AYD40178.1 PqqD family protein [Clostridium fermenticellae]